MQLSFNFGIKRFNYVKKNNNSNTKLKIVLKNSLLTSTIKKVSVNNNKQKTLLSFNIYYNLVL